MLRVSDAHVEAQIRDLIEFLYYLKKILTRIGSKGVHDFLVRNKEVKSMRGTTDDKLTIDC